MTNSEERLHAKARMDRQVRRKNELVRERRHCIYCDAVVNADGYDWKYAGAGGVLAGPFCGMKCQLGWLADG